MADEEQQLETAYISFAIADAEDVRHMILTMKTGVGLEVDPHTIRVVREIGLALGQGLHLRDPETISPDMMQDITAFHQFFGLEYKGKPRMLPQGLFDFREKFMQEELDEYREDQPKLATAIREANERDIAHFLEKQLDALVDEVYVVLGTAYLQFGAKAFNEAWKRVHYCNMQKVRAEADEDARSHRDTAFDVVKPEGWKAPDHADLVADHAHITYRKPGALNPGHERDTTVVPPPHKG